MEVMVRLNGGVRESYSRSGVCTSRGSNGLMVGFGTLVARSLPDIRRYIRISNLKRGFILGEGATETATRRVA
jgi:hypothetical protein